jgi:hypothetical protein
MKTIRENTYDVLLAALVRKGLLAPEEAARFAEGILARLAETGWTGEGEGPSDSMVLVTRRGVTQLFSRPPQLPVVWMNFDEMRQDGVDAVEVFS